MSKRYTVRKSDIHGKGVFAGRDIKKGELVGYYEGELIDKEEFRKRTDREGSVFFFSISDNVIIDAAVGGNGIRFINHSCSPRKSKLNR